MNQFFDRLVRPKIRVLHHSLSAFQVCGYTGLTLALAMGLGLAAAHGLALWVILVLLVTAASTFLTLAMLTKIVLGAENLVYYHQEIAVLLVTLWVLRWLGQPVLAYLDITILGVGLFLACGRIGCLMVGCCHGRPHRWGVCYRPEHGAAGFPGYFVGVRLFPIQAVESLWVAGVVLVGVLLVLGGSAPGAALAWYVVAYDLGRFTFEFGRGDAGRGYLYDFSEAQWTSLLLLLVVIGAEWQGALPWQGWHLVATAALVLAMVVVTLRRRRDPLAQECLLNPRHVREVATILNELNKQTVEAQGNATVVPLGATSLGLQFSSGAVTGPSGPIVHYTLSCRHGAMSRGLADLLTALIRQLRHPSGVPELVGRTPGVFHLLIHPAPSVEQPPIGTNRL